MPLALLVVLAPTHLEDSDLLVPPVRDDAGNDRRAHNKRRTSDQVGACTHGEYLVKRDILADFGHETLHLEGFACGNLVLLAAGFDDRVHENPSHGEKSAAVEKSL